MKNVLVKCCISRIIEGERDGMQLINLLSIIGSECGIASMNDLCNTTSIYTGMGIFINHSIKLIREGKVYEFVLNLKQKLIDIENYEAIIELKLETIN